jgi:hypothetical protein
MTRSSRGTRTSRILGFIAHQVVLIARACTQLGCAFFITPVVYIYARVIKTNKLQGRTVEARNHLQGASLQFGNKLTGSRTGKFAFASKLKLSVSISTVAVFAAVLVLAPIGMLSFDLLGTKDVQAATNEATKLPGEVAYLRWRTWCQTATTTSSLRFTQVAMAT